MNTSTQSPTIGASFRRRLKTHPELINLSIPRCPMCKAKFKNPFSLNAVGHVVEIKCPKSSCGFSMPIFWIGDTPRRN